MLIKKKLVTFCGRDNNEFSSCYLPFTYYGNSNKEQSSIKFSLPTYPENLVYYEHYDHASAREPIHLSFLLIGADDDHKLNHDFKSYQNVRLVDFSNTFASVRSLFQIVSRIPSCEEMRIFLSEKNFTLLKADQTLLENDVDLPKCPNLKSFSISLKQEDMDSKFDFDYAKSRIPEICRYLISCCPNIESLKMSLTERHGFDWINYLLERMSIKDTHKVTLAMGKAKCVPLPKVKSFNLKKSTSSTSSLSLSPSCSSSQEETCCNPPSEELKKEAAVSPTVAETPTISSVVVSHSEKSPPEKKAHKIDDDDVKEVKPPTPPPVEYLDLVSDDEDELEPPVKKVKLEAEPATGSKITLPSPAGKEGTNEEGNSNNSLSKIVKSYDNDFDRWEGDSDDEAHENILPTDLIKTINFDQTKVLQALQTATALKEFLKSDDKPKIDCPAPTPRNYNNITSPPDFIEGVHYERRRPLRRSKHDDRKNWNPTRHNPS